MRSTAGHCIGRGDFERLGAPVQRSQRKFNNSLAVLQALLRERNVLMTKARAKVDMPITLDFRILHVFCSP